MAPRGHLPFAIWNRTGNRLVTLLLRSSLHPLASGRLALITVTGRRSGRAITLPVGYRRDDGHLRIPVVFPERKLWWRNLRGGAAVTIRLRGEDRRGRAEALETGAGSVSVSVVLDEPAAR
jgi:hypothetical protein